MAVIIIILEQCGFPIDTVCRDSQEIAVIILTVEVCGFPIQSMETAKRLLSLSRQWNSVVFLYSLWRQLRDCCHYPDSGTVWFSYTVFGDSQEIAVIILTVEQCGFPIQSVETAKRLLSLS